MTESGGDRPSNINQQLEMLIEQVGLLTEGLTEFRSTIQQSLTSFRGTMLQSLDEFRTTMERSLSEFGAKLDRIEAITQRQAETARQQAETTARLWNFHNAMQNPPPKKNLYAVDFVVINV